MTVTNRRAATCLALFLVAACDGPVAPEPDAGPATLVAGARGGGGSNQGRKTKDEDPDPVPVPNYAWYELGAPDQADPLARFGLDGDRILLESDPEVAAWGTDFWGTWSEPFVLAEGVVTYVDGLTVTTYTLAPSAEGFDVSKEVVVRSYLGGTSSVTRSHVGIFMPVD